MYCTFIIQSVGECTEQYPTQGFAYLRSVVGNLSVTVNLTINNALLSGITREVPSDKHYFLDMMLHNKAGSILSTQLTKFSTLVTYTNTHSMSQHEIHYFKQQWLNPIIMIARYYLLCTIL